MYAYLSENRKLLCKKTQQHRSSFCLIVDILPVPVLGINFPDFLAFILKRENNPLQNQCSFIDRLLPPSATGTNSVVEGQAQTEP